MSKYSVSLFVSAVLILGSMSLAAQAAPWNGFCWGQRVDGVHCTEIAPAPLPMGYLCSHWASTIGAASSGSFRDTDLNRLLGKQEDACNYVVSKNKYECFAVQHCGGSDSTQLTHHWVFAADMPGAVSACVSRAGTEYLAALGALPAGCSLSVKAVMTLP